MATAAPAQNLPLFYNGLEPLNVTQHGKMKVRRVLRMAQVGHTHAIPVTVDEFTMVQRHYPIVFSIGDNPVPIALMGLNEGVNVFIDEEGRPLDTSLYIPAYVRRYPFVFSQVPDSDRLVLCVDEAAAQFETESSQPFFVDGKPSENLQRALKFTEMFHAQLDETRRFCTWLEENNMLEEKMARYDLANGESLTMRGFRLLNSEKMNLLTDVQILELHKKGWLALLYFHLQSLQHWQTLSRMVAQQQAAAA